MRHNDSGHHADVPARDVMPVTPRELRTAAAALARSYPSVRQYAATVRAAAAYIEQLERIATLRTFEGRGRHGCR